MAIHVSTKRSSFNDMDSAVTPLKKNLLVSIDKNYGRRHDTLLKKACELYGSYGGPFQLEGGEHGGDELMKVTVIAQFGGFGSVFSTHWDQHWPPNREQLADFEYIEGPEDYAMRSSFGKETVSDAVKRRFPTTITQRTKAPASRFHRTLCARDFRHTEGNHPSVPTPSIATQQCATVVPHLEEQGNVYSQEFNLNESQDPTSIPDSEHSTLQQALPATPTSIVRSPRQAATTPSLRQLSPAGSLRFNLEKVIGNSRSPSAERRSKILAAQRKSNKISLRDRLSRPFGSS